MRINTHSFRKLPVLFVLLIVGSIGINAIHSSLKRNMAAVESKVVATPPAQAYEKLNPTILSRAGQSTLASMMASSTLDLSFDQGGNFSGNISAMVLQPDGKVLIAGNFTTNNAAAKNNIARLNADGSVDVTFTSGTGPDQTIDAVELQPDGKILIGGNFTTYNGTTRHKIARLNQNGTLDQTFNLGTISNISTSNIRSILVQSDGKVIIGGNFTNINGTARFRIARLNTDGSVDSSFNPGTGFNGSVTAMAKQSDGKILAVGLFNTFNGVTRKFVARLNVDGTLDTSFDPAESAEATYTGAGLYSVFVQPDGKILLGGNFTSFKGVPKVCLVRLNVDGTIDTSFDPGTSFGFVFGNVRTPNSIVVQPNGKILVGGNFPTFQGSGRNAIARLNHDGSIDTSFDPGTGCQGYVNSVVLQPNGMFIIGGQFTTYDGTSRKGIARLTTGPVLEINGTPIQSNSSVKVESNMGDPGNLSVTEKGVIYIDKALSASPDLQTANVVKVVDGTVVSGDYTALASGLSPDKTYVAKAYAKTSTGTVFYSAVTEFSSNTTPSVNHTLTGGVLPLSVVENTTMVLDVLVTDADAGQTLSASLEGADAAKFSIDPTTRRLSFQVAPDFESRTDLDADNVYEVAVKVTDNAATPKSGLLPVRVTVTDVAENPLVENKTPADLGATGVKLNATILHNGGGGAISASGFVLSPTSSNAAPVLGGSGVTTVQVGATSGDFFKVVTGLQAGTAYSYRAFATNANGTGYAPVSTFTTLTAAVAPPVITYAPSVNNLLNTSIDTVSPVLLGSSVSATVFANVTTVSTNVSGVRGAVMDALGNLYIAETTGKRISKFSPNGTKTVIKQFDSFEPVGIVIDSKTGDLYASIVTHRIIWIPNTNKANYPAQQPTHVWTNDATNVFAGSSSSGTTDNVAGTNARFNGTLGLSMSLDNSYLLVCDYNNHRVRKIDIATKMVTTFAGSTTSGTANGHRLTAARFQNPESVHIAKDGTVYVTEINGTNHRVRKIVGDEVTTLAGAAAGFVEGDATVARLNEPRGVTTDAAGNVYVAEGGTDLIRKITPAGNVSILAGWGSGYADGAGYSARFDNPFEVYFAPDGFLYVGEYSGNKVRKISLSGYEMVGNLPLGLNFSQTTGKISGKPTQYTLQPYYQSDFENGIAYDGGQGVITPVLNGNATQFGSLLRLTEAVNTQSGGVTIPASGRKSRQLAVEFELMTTKTSGGADGISYSFAADADAAAASPNAEIGTGSGLSLSFTTYQNGGIRLYYGANKAATNTVGQSGLLAYNASNAWRGKAVSVRLSIYRDSVTVYVDNVLTFDRVALPAAYKIASHDTWKHVFKARTGGSNDVHSLSRLSINHGYGLAKMEVTARSPLGSHTAQLDLNVVSAPAVQTLAVSGIGFDTATAGVVVQLTGNLPISGGVIWGTSPNLTLQNAAGKIEQAIILDTLRTVIKGLEDATKYYVRAFATNTVGTAYGTELSFTTRLSPPVISYTSRSLYLKSGAATNVAATSTGGVVPAGLTGTVTTYAGSTTGFADGPLATAKFNGPKGIDIDKAGNLYVFDGYSKGGTIRKISTDGQVTTIAGSAEQTGYVDAKGKNARFNYGSLGSLTVDSLGVIFVTDVYSYRIRKIDTDTMVTTFAGSNSGDQTGPNLSAKFTFPIGIVKNKAGDLLVTDLDNHKIRKISGGNVSTLAGSTAGIANGPLLNAKFTSPLDVCLDAKGNLYVVDRHTVRKIDLITNSVSLVAGNLNGLSGSVNDNGSKAMFYSPTGIVVDGMNNVYVAEQYASRIRKIDADGNVTTLAGSTIGNVNGVGSEAKFGILTDLAIDATGDNLYVTDPNNAQIRKVTTTGWSITPALPPGLTLNNDGSISGTPTEVTAERFYIVTATNAAGVDTFLFRLKVDEVGLASLSLSQGSLDPVFAPSSVNYVTVYKTAVPSITFTAVEQFAGSTIRWKLGNGSFATIASGTPSPSIPLLDGENMLTIEVSEGGKTKTYTVLLRNPSLPPVINYNPEVTLTIQEPVTPLLANNTGGSVPLRMQNEVSTLAGSITGYQDGTGSNAKFFDIKGMAVDPIGNVFVLDDNRIRKVTPGGTVTTLAGGNFAGQVDGPGNVATFNGPTGLVLDRAGNLYVSESHRIRKVTPDGFVSRYAGTDLGMGDGPITTAKFGRLEGITLDRDGNIYVADYVNDYITTSSASLAYDLAIPGPGANAAAASASAAAAPASGASAAASIPQTLVQLRRIRKISPDGTVSTLAGAGPGYYDGLSNAAKFNFFKGIAVDSQNYVYVNDFGNQKIRKITPGGLVSSVVANTAQAFTVDGSGNLYAAALNIFVKVTPNGQVIVTNFAGIGYVDGPASSAKFNSPSRLAVDQSGNIYVSESSGPRIRVINTQGWDVTPALPAGLVLNNDGSISGTPTALSEAKNYIISARNAGGISYDTIRIEVTAGPTEGLRSLLLSEGTLSPSFSSSKYQYTTQVPSTSDKISFKPTAINTSAQLQLNGSAVTNDVFTGDYTLNYGPNTFTIVVTDNGGVKNTYSVVVTRPLAQSQAQNLWKGTGSQIWSSTGNWTGNALPNSGGDVIFSPNAVNDLEADSDLTAGTINFNGSDKKVVLAANSLTVAGFSNRTADNYVKLTGTGRLKINIQGGEKALFPVAMDKYSPISITNQGTQAMEYSINTGADVYQQGNQGSPLPNMRIKRIWDISTTTNTVSSPGIDMEFSWDAADDTGVQNPSLFHYDGVAWVKLDAAKTMVDLTNRSLVYTGYTGGLSPFAIFDELPTETQLTISAPTLTKIKTYDKTKTAQVTAGTLSGVQMGDDVSVTAVAEYDNAQSGTGKIIRVVYTITGADIGKYIKPADDVYTDGEITKIQLTATPAALTTSKVYDGTKIAAVTGGTLQGVLSDETVTAVASATYATSTAGTNKTITVVYTLGGGNAGNYLAPVNEVVTTGEITKAVVTITVNDDSKFIGQADTAVYNGITVTGFIVDEDTSYLNGNLLITRTNAAVNTAGNYPNVLVASGFTSDNYTINYVAGDFSIVPADVLVVKLNPIQTVYGLDHVYPLKSAGYYSSSQSKLVDLTEGTTISDSTVLVSDGLSTTIFDFVVKNPLYSTSGRLKAGMYTIDSSKVRLSSSVNSLKVIGTLNVVPILATASLSSSADKEYDGTRDLLSPVLEVSGLLSNDVTSLSHTSALYSNAGAGNRTYTVSGVSLTGADASNYTVLPSFTGQGSISKKLLTMSGTLVTKSNVYDGDTLANVAVGTVAGLINGDDVEVKAKASYLDKYVGTNKNMRLTYSLGGAAAGNYIVPEGELFVDGVITRKPLVLTDPSVVLRKEYDGTRSASATAGSLLGLVAGDDVTVTASASYNTASRGMNRIITVKYSLGGADTFNYSIVLQDYVTNLGEIYSLGPIQLLITEPALTLVKDYDGNDGAAATPGQLIGLDEGHSVQVTVMSSKYQDAQADSSKTVTIKYSLSGPNASDYTAPPDYQVPTGVIEPITLTIKAKDQSKMYDGVPYTGGNGVTYTGFVNSETETVLGGTLGFGGTSQGATAIGTYAITPSGLTSDNYDIAFENGTLTITAVVPAAPTALMATAGDKQADISFTKGSDGGSPIINYEYTLDGGMNWMSFSPADTMSPVTITGLTNGVTYTIALRAVNAIGAGPSSAPVMVMPVCQNPTSGGEIEADQTICINTVADTIENKTLPSGEVGVLEYQWQSSVTSSAAGFTEIAGATSADYEPGTLTQNTWYKRLSKVTCESTWVASNVVAITVNPNNTVGAASSAPSVCNSSVMTSITHSTTGATGIGTATGLPAGVTADWAANTITISGTPTENGTFTYSIPLTGGCGSVSATGTIIVNALPVPAILVAEESSLASEDGIICSGASAQLTATGGSTYLWGGGQTVSSITVSPTNKTKYSVTVTSSAGCTALDTMSILVLTSPDVTVTSTVPVCLNDNTGILTASSGTGWNYLWSTGETTAVISNLVQGMYAVTVTDTNLCTDTVSVNLVSLAAGPLPGPSNTAWANADCDSDGEKNGTDPAPLNGCVFSSGHVPPPSAPVCAVKIGNLVWHDVDNDGVQEPGDTGIDGVNVSLTWAGPDGNLATTSDNQIWSVVTGPAGGFDTGEYYFDAPEPGLYKLVFTTPATYVPTKRNVGNVWEGGDTDSDAGSVNMNLNAVEEIFTITSLTNVKLGENGIGDNSTTSMLIILDTRADESHDAGFWQPCCPPNK